MILAVAATEIEMKPLRLILGDRTDYLDCVAGVGPVETAVRLTPFLQQLVSQKTIEAVVNFGVAGAYLPLKGRKGASLLEICLAEQEIFGDCGICFEDRFEPLPVDLKVKTSFNLNTEWLVHAKRIFSENGLTCHSGNFITVSGASGTAKRGERLCQQFMGLCENMEGAAVARVCHEFSLPLIEVRCISNMVENRDVSRWKLEEACEKAAFSASLLVKHL